MPLPCPDCGEEPCVCDPTRAFPLVPYPPISGAPRDLHEREIAFPTGAALDALMRNAPTALDKAYQPSWKKLNHGAAALGPDEPSLLAEDEPASSKTDDRATRALETPPDSMTTEQLRLAVADLRRFIAGATTAPAPVAPVPSQATPVPGLPPGTNIERMRAPDGSLREVVRVGYNVHHVAQVELEACKCGARFVSPEEGMVALARKHKDLPPAVCHRCGRIIIGEKKLVELAQ